MADDSGMDYIRTFLLKVHTAATTKTIEETPAIYLIADTERMLVSESEIMFADDQITKKRFKVVISSVTEASLETAINNILIGLGKLNRREAITSYTRPATLHNIKMLSQGIAKHDGLTKRYNQEIQLEAQFGTA